MLIPVGPWTPDTPDLASEGSLEALNCFPASKSYRPFPSFAALTAAADARIQGAFFARASNGTGLLLVGTVDKLYSVNGAALADVSRVAGGAYACPSDGLWDFKQFANIVYAQNGVDAMQQFDIDSDSNFSAAGGSPPIAKYGTVVSRFFMTGNQGSARNRLQWGPIDNAGSWASSQVTQASQQDLSDGGWVQGLTSFDLGCTIFQEFAVSAGQYVGVPDIFQFRKIADNIGLTIPGSLATYKERTFFCDRSGFYVVLYGTVIEPIGQERVNNWFWGLVDQTQLPRVCSAIDQVNQLYAVAFPDANAASGNPNNILLYNWAVDRFAHVNGLNIELMFSGATQQAWTIEQLSAAYGAIENIPFPFDSQVWTGIAHRLIGAADATHRIGFFNGAAMAATVDTVEAAPGAGKLVRVRGARPLVDGDTPQMQLGFRNRQTDAVVFGPSVSVNGLGTCPMNQAARYVRGRIKTTAGARWNHVIGIDDLDIRPEGRF